MATSRLNPETLKEILARGEGNPLYIEELTRSVQQQHAGATAQTGVPASLRDSLMARLDALGFGKLVAQWASVIGRTFDSAVLHAVWDKAPEDLQHGLEELDITASYHVKERESSPVLSSDIISFATPPTTRCCAMHAVSCI